MAREDENMDDILYRAARVRGAPIPVVINFNSRTLSDGNNALHVAAQYGNHRFITQALPRLGGEHQYQHLCPRNSNGESTPLHLAAQFGHLQTVRVLLGAYLNAAQGVDLGERMLYWRETDNQGDTPLHKALKHRHGGIAMELLAAECMYSGNQNILVSVVNDEGESLAYLAAENSCSNFLLEIFRHYDENVVRVSGYKGQTVLHSVARSSKKYLMRTLIETVGIPLLRKKDNFGKTALHCAVEVYRSVMVKELLRADSSLAYLHDKDGLTPLHIAFEEGLYPIVIIILKMSPQSIEKRDNHGRSPLHYAKMDGDFLEKCRTTIDRRILRLLINQVDNDGNTPLHVALLNSKPDSAYQLLHIKGCNSMMRNKDGYTPWDLCKSNDNIPNTSQVYMELRRDRAFTKKRRRDCSNANLEVTKDEDKLLDKIAVAAALLLPLNFATTFSVPGGYDNTTGEPILKYQHTFHVYVISNMIAFLATMLILIGCTFGIGRRVNKKQLAKLNIFLLQVALFTTLIAYVGGILAMGNIGRDYKARFPTILLSLGVGIVSSLLVINWFN